MAASLRVDWATYAAAKHAVETWHYSAAMPMPPLTCVGAWEESKYIGAVVFGRGACKTLGAPYGLGMTECCELVRVALRDHQSPVSQIVARAVKMLKKREPALRLIVSFADPAEGHAGTIYQAMNWIYAGKTSASWEYRLNGKRLNRRAYTGVQFNGASNRASVPRGAVKVNVPGKHRYLMPLDKEMRGICQKFSAEYPKRAGSADSGTPDHQSGGGSANLTPALQ